MKPEILEALLIDRALGQLAPEVAALLAEYLATHPEAGQSVAGWDETVALASQAMPRPTRRLALPPRTVAIFPRRHPVRRLAALAASFAAGIGVAVLGLRSTSPQLEVPPPVAAVSRPVAPFVATIPPVRKAEVDPTVRSLPFWSTERAVALAAARQNPNRVIP